MKPADPPPQPSKTPEGREPSFVPIVLFLTLAGFCISFNLRLTDPLLPPLAAEFSTTPGTVAIVVVFYAIAHGFMQLAGGPVGDRFGKLRVITLAAYASAGTTAAASLAGSIPELAALRFLSGATAAVIFPLAFAWVGDVVAYEKRQIIIARMFGGAMLGAMTGQAISGVFADFVGWRGVFLLAGSMFLIAAVGLTFSSSLRGTTPQRSRKRFIDELLTPIKLLRKREPRLVLGTCAAEGFFVMSATAFLGAYLHDDFGLTFSQVGLILAMFGGGGLFYTLNAGWLIGRLGERRLVAYGGAIFSVAFLTIAFVPFWHAVPILLFICGASILMLHNTLQLRASQMAPEARGAAMSAFAASFFVGQLAGIAVLGPAYDRFGGTVVVAVAAVGFAIVAATYLAHLRPADSAT